MPNDTETIIQKIGEVGASLEETRQKLDTKIDKGMLKETEDRIVQDLVAKFKEHQDMRLKEEGEKRDKERDELLQRYDALETEFRRSATGNQSDEDKVAAEHRVAFRAFLNDGETTETRGYIGKAGYEKRNLLSGTDTKGGFLVPQYIDTEIDKLIVSIDPISALARVITLTQGNAYESFRRTGTPTAGWVAEGAQQAESSSTYGKGRIPVHWLSAETKVSNELLADVANIESEVMSDAAEQFAYAENYAYVKGTGIGQPTGFTVNSTLVTATGEDTTNHLVTADDLITLKLTPKAPYRSQGRYGFNSTVLGKIMKLKDDNNQYLWLWPQGMRSAEPNTILGQPFDLIESMASDGTQNNLAVVFADWQRWYRIVVRQGTEVLRDPFTSKPSVEFNWYRRVGGDIWRTEAGAMLKCG